MSDLDDDLAPGIQSRIVREAIKFWELADAAERDNRIRGLRALQFTQGGDEQWDPILLSTRREDARPCESYNQIPNFVNQVVNDGRMNMPQTRFVAGEDGEVETAERMEDLARNIQQQSDAEIAYDTALYGQCVAGWGYWRYITEYENDKSFDQIIKIKPVWNQFTVYDDPYAIEPDKLDRKRLIQVTDMQLSDFNDTYDREYDASDLEGIGDSSPAWASSSDTIRVAEFWKVVETESSLYRNKKTGAITKEKPKDLNNYDTRVVKEQKVKWYLINGKEVLKSRDWPGIYIPYVKVVGQEVIVDGKTIISGIVERMIPAQKQMNYWTNAATEMVALAPKSPFIADPKAIGAYQSVWDQANVRNFAYLPYNSTDEKGQPLAVPQRANNGADIGAMVAMTQQAQQAFYNLSGIFPASLGQASNEKSGRAILARQKEGDTATFHIHDNMTRGQRAGGRILADLMPKIYDGSRTVIGKREDGSTYTIPINQKYKDKKSNKAKEHDFTVGTYSVAVTTGPTYTTKRAESSEFYQSLAQSFPPIMELAGDIVVGSSDAAGAEAAAERIKKYIEMTKPGLIDEEDSEANKIPPAVQQQMAQAQQAIQELGTELQSTQAELQNKQADNALKAQANQLKAQEIQIKQGELQLKAQELAVREQEIQADVVKTRITAKAGADPMVAMTDPDMQEGGEVPLIMQWLQQNSMMQEQNTAALNQGLQQIAQITAAGQQAIVESNNVIAATTNRAAEATEMLAAQVARPKEIVYNEQGRIAGVN